MAITSLGRIVGNALSMLTSDVVNKATTFVLYVLVARHLGAFGFGQLSLALTLFYIFQVLAVAGLKTFVTREVAKDRTKTDQYILNGSMVVTTSSLLSIFILQMFVRVMNYSTGTASVILLLSLGLLPYSLSAICEGVFQAREQMRYIAYANVPVNIAKVTFAFLILSQDYGLYHLVTILLASHVAVMAVEWWLLFKHISKPRGRIDPHVCLTLTTSTSTFLGIDGIIAIMSSLMIILLSKLGGETEVGIYSAATQLMVPVTLVYQSIDASVFPVMCRKFKPGFQSVEPLSEHLIELLFAIAVPAVVGLFLLADSVLSLLYGANAFLRASGVLRIMVWNLILIALTTGLGQVLLAGLREKITLRIVAIDTLVSLASGLILIRQLGLIGAAIATLLTRIVDFLQHYVTVSRLLSHIRLRKLLWKPIVAAALMAVYLMVTRSHGVFLTIIFSAALYAGILLALAIWSDGGLLQLRDRYQYLWSE